MDQSQKIKQLEGELEYLSKKLSVLYGFIRLKNNLQLDAYEDYCKLLTLHPHSLNNDVSRTNYLKLLADTLNKARV